MSSFAISFFERPRAQRGASVAAQWPAASSSMTIPPPGSPGAHLDAGWIFSWPRCSFVTALHTDIGHRASIVWIALLGAIELTDVLTTAMGQARGAIEAMPVSAAVIDSGGMMLFVVVKLALVILVAGAVLLALRWMRNGHPGADAVFAFTLSSVRVATVALAVVSLHNAVLLTTLRA